VSTKRKKPRGNPAAGPRTPKMIQPATPQELLGQLTHSTAVRVMEGLKVLEKFAKDYPHVQGLATTMLNYEVAALALVEALDEQNGLTPKRLSELKKH
jgi:hypothetical protein